MKVDYNDLLEEIAEITTVDGFVSACLEIKESMFFYDRDLMLAAFSASLELLAVAALFSASLQDEQDWVENEVVRNIEELLEELAKYRLPLDIQYVVDRYLHDAGLQTSLRLPVYINMIRNYAAGAEYTEESIDHLLREAHRLLQSNNDTQEAELNDLLGQVGVKMLRGGHLRPVWLQISHPRIYFILVGLQTMMNNFRVTPYFNFPLEEIAVERQKRKKIGGNVVLDLSVFRNFRQGGSGYTDLNVALNKDDYDCFLENLLDNFEYLEIEPDETFVEMIIAIFETRLVNDEIEELLLLKLLAYCDYWQLSQVSDVVLELLELLEPEEPLFLRLWILMRSFGSKSYPAIRRFIRAKPDSHLIPYLSLFLSHGKPNKRKWSLLKEIFANYPPDDEDWGQIALAVARCGGADAVPILEEAINSVPSPVYRSVLKEALDLAKANSS